MFEAIEHVPAVHHRQLHVEDDRVGLELVCERKARVAADRNDSLEAALAGDLQLRAGEVWVVLDDQHDAVAVLDVVTIVADVARKEQCRVELRLVVIVCRRRAASVAVAWQHDCRLERNGGIRMLGRLVRGRQEQREPAAPTDLALDVDLAA